MKKNYLPKLIIALAFFTNLVHAQSQSLDFDGINDVVNGPIELIPVSGDYTVSVWAKQNNFQTGVQKNIVSQGRYFYIGQYNSDTIRIGDNWHNTGVLWPTDLNWHNYAVVRTNTNTFLYLDGLLVSTKGSSIPSPTNSAPGIPSIAQFFIGSQWTGNSEHFNGSIDELRVWDRQLTTAEIYNNLNCEIPGSAFGLIAYYHFNQGNPGGPNPGLTTLLDASGNNFNDTLINFALNGSTSNWVSPGAVVTGNYCINCNPVITCPPDITVCQTVACPLRFYPDTIALAPTIEFVERYISYSGVSINGGGNSKVVSPGSNVSLSYNFSVNFDHTNGYCTGCVVQSYIGIGSTSQTIHCTQYLSSIPNGTVTPVSTNFTAPTAPGIYYLTQSGTLDFICQPRNFSNQPSEAIGVIVVGPTYATATGCFPITITNNAPPCFPAGTTLVTWTATDSIGNFSTCMQNVSVFPAATYYADADVDGFGNPNDSIVSCTVIPGRVTNNTDCNDTQYQYSDIDQDGFGMGVPVACGATNNIDCNDTLLLYFDYDEDGFGTGAPAACGAPTNDDCNDSEFQYGDLDNDGFGAGNPVACGASNNSDCNDTLLLYFDYDDDGFGTGAPIACGVPTNDDCNDSEYQYADIDEDGFGAGDPVACGVPNNTDCDDANPNITENIEVGIIASTLELSSCNINSSTLSVGLINQTRFVDSIMDFSSEYELAARCLNCYPPYSASQLIGQPDVYPSYGDIDESWSPLSQDDQREYVVVKFGDPAPINFIDIYETYNPGAIDTVYIKNPNTGQFEVVYTHTAGPIGAISRKLHISFPLTAFDVTEVRIALNSPAVWDWNEIDAIGIGEIVADTFLNYLWSTGETTSTVQVNNPGSYSVTVTASPTCMNLSSSQIEIISTQVSLGPDIIVCPEKLTLLAVRKSASYLWSTGDTTNSITVQPTDTTIYSVIATDAYGCVSTDSIILYLYPAINPGPVIITNGSCNNSGEGSINIGPASGGTPGEGGGGDRGTNKMMMRKAPASIGNTSTESLFDVYTYYVSGDELYIENNSGYFDELNPGTYTVGVRDDAGCGFDTIVVVGVDNPFTATAFALSPIICKGEVTDITFNISGGVPPYYIFQDDESSPDTTDLGAGTYYFNISDDGDCGENLYVEVTIEEYPELEPIILSSGGFEVCDEDSITLSVQSPSGNALQFDGADDFVEGHNNLLPLGNSPRSIEAWIKPSAYQNGTIFNWGDSASQIVNGRSGLLIINSKLYFVGELNDFQGSVIIDTGVWTHVAMTFDGDSLKLFVNGVLDSVTFKNLATNSDYYRIGNGNPLMPYEPFNGTIDEIRVWDYALPQSALLQNMGNSVSASSPGLVAYFNVENGTDSTTVNAAPNSETAAFVNGTTTVSSTAPVNSYASYVWMPGGLTTSSIIVIAANSYTVTVTSLLGCTASTFVDVTYAPCIIPGVPPSDSGWVGDLIGTELTQLYNFQPIIADTTTSVIPVQTKNETFLLNNDSVLIEIIAVDDKYDSIKALVQTPPYGMRDLIYNGVDSFIITGTYPIVNLLKLNLLPDLIKYVRPYFPPVAGATAKYPSSAGVAYSLGDVAQRSSFARKIFNVDGSSVKIGVLSDSYNKLSGASANIANNDLPGGLNGSTPVTLRKEFPYGSGTDEGRAMLQIAHDVAPAAKMAFRTGFISAGDFALGIRQLWEIDSCDIMVDDITYITEPFFQDGIISHAVDYVKSQGVSYFTSAGNFGDKSYMSDFHPVTIPNGMIAHDFSNGTVVGGDFKQSVTLPSGVYTIVLQWGDSIYSQGQLIGARNDFDIFLVDDLDQILFGFNRNNTGGDPYEVLSFTVKGTAHANIMVVRRSTLNPLETVQFKYITYRGEIKIDEYNSDPAGKSTIVGQANAAGAITVGAVLYLNTPTITPDSVVVPSAATFSSIGRTPVYGNLRNKPDIMAPNGVNTTVFLNGVNIDNDSFPNFFGTSAAAPHAAAVAGLIMDARRKFWDERMNPDEIRALLDSTAIDMNTAGYDQYSGYGFIQADAAIRTFAAPIAILDSLEFPPNAIPPIPPVLDLNNPIPDFPITIYGNYFSPTSVIYVRGDAIPTNYIDESHVVATLTNFYGNPDIRVYNPPISPSNLDGGFSNTLFLYPSNKKTVRVMANSATKLYGEKLPVFSASVTINDTLIEDTDYTLHDLGLDSLTFESTAGNLSDVGTYFIIPKIDSVLNVNILDSSLLESYNYIFEDSLLFIRRMPLVITPNDTTIIYGDRIGGFTFHYSYDSLNIDSADRIVFLNDLQAEHYSDIVNEIILVNAKNYINGFGNITNADLVNMSFMVSFKAAINARNYINAKNFINSFDTTRIVDVSPESIFQYNIDSANATLFNAKNYVNFKAAVNAKNYINGTATVNVAGQPQANAKNFINGSSQVDSTAVLDNSNRNTVIIFDEDDFNAAPDTVVIDEVKAINMITGTDVGEHAIVPGGFFNFYSNNYIISYGIGKLTILPDTLIVTANDTVVNCGPNAEFTSTIKGYNYADNDSSSLASLPLYHVIDSITNDTVQIADLSDGTYYVAPYGAVVSNDSNYFIGSYINGKLYVKSAPTVAVVNNCGVSTLTASNYTGALLWSTGDTTPSIMVNSTGERTVSQNINGCISTPGKGTANPYQYPIIDSISSSYNICVPNSGQATVYASGGTFPYYYLWGPGGNTTQSVTGLCPDIYTISVTDANGCVINSAVSIEASGGGLSTPGQINGLMVVCSGKKGVPYSIAPVPNATSYTWYTATGIVIASGQGTNSVLLNFSNGFANGTINVKANSAACGSSSPRILAIQGINAKPTSPTTIAGPGNVCKGSTATYNIPPVAKTDSYLWTVTGGLIITSGQGTTSITVNVPTSYSNGYVKVKAVNCKGSSYDRSFGVKGITVPAQPGSISGSSPICINTIKTYSISKVASASSYNWTISGLPYNIVTNNGNAIDVNFSVPGSAALSVYASNICGSGLPRMRSITVNTCTRIYEGYYADEPLIVYPNPAKDKLNIDFISSLQQEYNVRLTDILGHIMIDVKQNVSEGENHFEFNIDHLAKGVYFLNFRPNNLQDSSLFPAKDIRIIKD